MIKLSNKHKVIPAIPGSRKGRKTTGQGMVEFALALPILLLVVYGLLETGRLLFIYSSTITAARQAARYGSATGDSDAGMPFYRDCSGIEGAVNRVGFLNTFTDIHITYDRGLDADGDVIAIPGIDPAPTADTCDEIQDDDLRNGDRIKVQVSTQWEPIIAIVPSWQGFTITSSAERTLLMSVAIGVDPEAESWVPGASLQVTISGSPATFNAVGQTLSYTYTIRNNGNFTLTAPFTLVDDTVTTSCSGAPASLLIGQTFTCTGTYTTTQADLDSGGVTNTAIATATEATSLAGTLTIDAIQSPSLNLAKTASPTTAGTAGTVVTYTYKLTNTGNVTLSGPYTVTDDKIASDQITCPAGTIAPGSFIQCTGNYSITDTDITNGAVTNTAAAAATFDGAPVTSNSASATVNTAPLELTVTRSVATVSVLNQKITYTYTLKNLGAASLFAPYGVTDNRATNLSCPSLLSLGPGDTTQCTGEYYVTQADLDSGADLVNTARASANSGAVESNPASSTVTVSRLPAISLTVSPSTALATTLGTSIGYTYTVKNDGNVTLTAPFTVTDLGIIGSPTCTISSGTLAPGATTPCALNYSVVQADLDAGSIINLASVSTTYDGNSVSSTQATATVITYNSPRLTLLISSTPTSYQDNVTPLTIKFKLWNTGNAALTSPYSVTATVNGSAFPNPINCSAAISPLPIGQSTDCTSTYTPTSTDLSTGSFTVAATATATGAPADSDSKTINSTIQCYVYHRLTSTPAPSVTFSGNGANRKMYMSVINDSATTATIHIKQLEVRNWNYSSPNGQMISKVFFGGVQIITGNNTQLTDPVIYTSFTGDVSLAPGQTKILMFEFNKNYAETNNEVIKVTFAETGCPLLDSSVGTQVK